MAVGVADSATPERAFGLEPYSYAEAHALMEALGLAEPVAVALVRRGYRTVEQARAVLGARCDWFIPDRLGDGYGLTVDGIERLAARGTRLLVTVDCGIACSTEVA